MGLRLVLQPRPLCPALYAISVRRLGTLPAASFRFHLTMDTLAVRLTLPTTKRVVDFHHQAIAHAGRTAKPPPRVERRERAAEGISSVEDETLRLLHDDVVVLKCKRVSLLQVDLDRGVVIRQHGFKVRVFEVIDGVLGGAHARRRFAVAV